MRVIKGLVLFAAVGVLAGIAAEVLTGAVPVGTLHPVGQVGVLLAGFTLVAVHVGGLFVAAMGAVMAVHQYATEGRIVSGFKGND